MKPRDEKSVAGRGLFHGDNASSPTFCTIVIWLALAGLLLGFMASRAWAWDTRKPVTQDPEPETFATLAVDSQGRVHMVWDRPGTFSYNNQEYPSNTVWYARYHYQQGLPLEELMLLKAPGQSGGHYCVTTPHCALDANDTIHIVWSAQPIENEYPPPPVGEKTMILYTRRMANGFWQPQPIPLSGYWGTAPGQSSHAQMPRLAMDQRGRVHVVWHQRHIEQHVHTFLDIYYRYSPDGGTQWAYPDHYGAGRHGRNLTQVDAAASNTCLCREPRLAVGADNTLHVVFKCFFKERPEDQRADLAYYMRADAAQLQWTDPFDTEVAPVYRKKKAVDITAWGNSAIDPITTPAPEFHPAIAFVASLEDDLRVVRTTVKIPGRPWSEDFIVADGPLTLNVKRINDTAVRIINDAGTLVVGVARDQTFGVWKKTQGVWQEDTGFGDTTGETWIFDLVSREHWLWALVPDKDATGGQDLWLNRNPTLAPQRPGLALLQTTPTAYQLRCPAEAAGFALEFAPTLAPPIQDILGIWWLQPSSKGRSL